MTSALRVAFVGLDERTRNLFRLFFSGPGRNLAVIVDHEDDADVFLVDLDCHVVSKWLAHARESHPGCVLILLSVREQAETNGSVFVKMPVEERALIEAVQKAGHMSKMRAASRGKPLQFGWASSDPSAAAGGQAAAAGIDPGLPAGSAQELESREPDWLGALPAAHAAKAQDRNQYLRIVSRPYRKQTAAHKVALLLDERGFKGCLGHIADIDPADFRQLAGVIYDPKNYLQGQVQAAARAALLHKKPLSLQTPWKTITILPQHGVIHIEADEAQLRAACGVPFRNFIGAGRQPRTYFEMVDIKSVGKQAIELLLRSDDLVQMEAFLWKVALFTSRGRLPTGIDPNQAVFLKRWPGMTRLMLPPHAMRIAALLAERPCSLFDAAKKIGIRQQYVFAFVSAAHALGLIGQQPLEAESALAAEKSVPSAQPERQSLFEEILRHLKLT